MDTKPCGCRDYGGLSQGSHGAAEEAGLQLGSCKTHRTRRGWDHWPPPHRGLHPSSEVVDCPTQLIYIWFFFMFYVMFHNQIKKHSREIWYFRRVFPLCCSTGYLEKHWGIDRMKHMDICISLSLWCLWPIYFTPFAINPVSSNLNILPIGNFLCKILTPCHVNDNGEILSEY